MRRVLLLVLLPLGACQAALPPDPTSSGSGGLAVPAAPVSTQSKPGVTQSPTPDPPATPPDPPADPSDLTPPTVAQANPAQGSVAALNTRIVFILSEPVKPSSVTAVSASCTGIAAIASVQGSTITLSPTSALPPLTAITCMLSKKITDLAGNGLADAFVLSFSTSDAADTLAPTATAQVPAVNAQNVPVPTIVSVTYSEPVQQVTTLLKKGTTVVAGTQGLSGQTATFTPAAPLEGSATYAATFTAADAAGNVVTTAWTFTTLAPPDTSAPTIVSLSPRNYAPNVPLTTTELVIEMSEAIDPASVANITAPVNVTISVTGKVIRVHFVSPLVAETKYELGFSHVRDLAGNTAAGRNIEFTTSRNGAAWTNPLQFPARTDGKAVAADAQGNIYVAHSMESGFAGAPIGRTDMVLTKLDPLGNILWAQRYGFDEDDWVADVAVAPNGNVYLLGTLYAYEDTPAHPSQIMLVAFSPSGSLLWEKELGATNAMDEASGLAVDASSSIYVIGNTFGALAAPNAGGKDAAVMKVTSAGVLAWQVQLGGPDEQRGVCAAVSPAGNVYVSVNSRGQFRDITWAGSGPDGLILQLNPLSGAVLREAWMNSTGDATDVCVVTGATLVFGVSSSAEFFVSAPNPSFHRKPIVRAMDQNLATVWKYQDVDDGIFSRGVTLGDSLIATTPSRVVRLNATGAATFDTYGIALPTIMDLVRTPSNQIFVLTQGNFEDAEITRFSSSLVIQ